MLKRKKFRRDTSMEISQTTFVSLSGPFQNPVTLSCFIIRIVSCFAFIRHEKQYAFRRCPAPPLFSGFVQSPEVQTNMKSIPDIEAHRNIDCLCAGIIVADHICAPIATLPAAGELVTSDAFLLNIGGCAANTAVDLQKIGVKVAIAGRVGQDLFGQFILESLQKSGIDTSSIKRTSRADTSQTMIVNVQNEDRRFIHGFGANAFFKGGDIPSETLARSRILYLGGNILMPALDQEDAIRIFKAARQLGVITVLDVAIPEPGHYLPQLEHILEHTDVFLPNTAEAELILGESRPIVQARKFQELGAETVVITCGNNGCVLVDSEIQIEVGVYPVSFLDGSGCGDAFDAGYIYGILQGFSPEECTRWGSVLGASCVRSIGTTNGVFTYDQASDFMKEHPLPIKTLKP